MTTIEDDMTALLDKAKEELNMLFVHLKERPDEKLIKGYKEAMKDYKETGNIKCKFSAQIIKQEIDRRGLKIDEA